MKSLSVKTFFIQSLAVLTLFAVLFIPAFTFAQQPQQFNFLEPLPGSATGGAANDPNLFSNYLVNVFNISIGASAILAVLMIVVGGVRYVGAAVSPSQKAAAKETITAALFGLIIVLGAYAILYTINSDLVTFGLSITCVDGTTPPCP